MRYLMVVLCSSTLIGCTSMGSEQLSLWHKFSKKEQVTYAQDSVENLSKLPAIDLSKEPSFTEQYRLGGFSIGSWIKQKPGQVFQKVDIRHPKAAMVYVYRPDTRWNRQEILAPNFFLNGQRIPSLLNNHHYWIEIPAGSYRLTSSHPLTVLHFQKPKVFDFDVDAGGTYFIKYEEQVFRTGGSYQKPFYMMSSQLGLREILTTQLKTPGISFLKYNELETTSLNENTQRGEYQSVSSTP